MAHAVFKPMGLGSANNQFMSGARRSRSSGFGPSKSNSRMSSGTKLEVTLMTPTAPAS